MADERSTFEELMESLRRERDELKLQMHLAGMEAKDEYERLTDKVDELSKQYEPVTDAVDEAAQNVLSALKLAGEEMLNGFHLVRKAIQKS